MSDKNKKPLIIIAGATAIGKTACAIKTAEKINGEIISADSMQVYKYMDIGTAKPSKEELSRVRHHLIDIVEPDFEYSVAVFKEMAKNAVTKIHSKSKIPILTGGTGFYIKALVYDNSFMSTTSCLDKTYRNYLYGLAEQRGGEFIYNMLTKADPESAETIHVRNIKRVIRALEYYQDTGEKFSTYNKREKMRQPAYNTHFFVLNKNRENLYKSINDRVDSMLNNGLVDEVKNLKDKGYGPELVSMQGLGYKEIYRYLLDELSLNDAIDLLKIGTRHFAKRQLTWFRNQTNGIWLDVDEYSGYDELSDEIINLVNIRDEKNLL